MPIAGLGSTPGALPPSDAPAPPKKPQTSAKTPGASFLDLLLAADQDQNGLTKGELAGVMAKLKALASDHQENDVAEKSVLSALSAAQSSNKDVPVTYEVTSQGLSLHVAEPSAIEEVFLFAGQKPGALKDGVMKKGDAVVTLGTDPGDFYCEHMFFSAQLAASLPGASVLTNKLGEKLVGFLHLPSDAYTAGELTVPSQAERHQATRQVVGAALRGYYEAAKANDPVRILVTGYDTFGWVKNNPTGDFVTHGENLDAAMKIAFGAALIQVGATETHGPLETHHYTVKDGKKSRQVVVSAIRFPVADPAIDPSAPGSIFHVVADAKPHAVLSMGVAGNGPYMAEFRADSGGLKRFGDHAAHEDGAPDQVRLRDNYALGRAIAAGAKKLA
ncbi:MAG: hypothetical protein U1E65_12225 [Myxococcota bacterium]